MSRSTRDIGSATGSRVLDSICTAGATDGAERGALLREPSGFDGSRRRYLLGRSYLAEIHISSLGCVTSGTATEIGVRLYFAEGPIRLSYASESRMLNRKMLSLKPHD